VTKTFELLLNLILVVCVMCCCLFQIVECRVWIRKSVLSCGTRYGTVCGDQMWVV